MGNYGPLLAIVTVISYCHFRLQKWNSCFTPCLFLRLVLFFPRQCTAHPHPSAHPPFPGSILYAPRCVERASGDRHCHPINIIATARSLAARVVATIPAIGSPLLRAPPPLIYLCLRRRRLRRRLRHQCIVKRAQSAFSSPSIRERLSILPYASPLSPPSTSAAYLPLLLLLALLTRYSPSPSLSLKGVHTSSSDVPITTMFTQNIVMLEHLEPTALT